MTPCDAGKRKRIQCLADHHDAPSSKRRDRNPYLHPALPDEAGSNGPTFWDSLSKVWLTRRALREFDRRTSRQAPRYIYPAPVIYPAPIEFSDSIAQFANNGGPDLRDIRSYPTPDPIMSAATPYDGSRPPQASGPSTSTRSSAYDGNFAQLLKDNRILPSTRSSKNKPDNWDDIQRCVVVPRASLSPEPVLQRKFRKYHKAADAATNEAAVMSQVFPKVIGNRRDVHWRENVLFTNLRPITKEEDDGAKDRDAGIVQAKPDYYEGSDPGSLNPQVRRDLHRVVVPSKDTSNPIVPNFACQIKPRSGNAAVMDRQALHDAANGARAINSLLCYGEPDSRAYNRASTATATYINGALEIHTTHTMPPKPPDNKETYVTRWVGSWHLGGGPGAFRAGVTAIRNVKEKMALERQMGIQHGNAQVRATEGSSTSSSTGPRVFSSNSSGTDAQESYTSNEIIPQQDSRSKRQIKDRHIPPAPPRRRRVQRVQQTHRHHGGKPPVSDALRRSARLQAYDHQRGLPAAVRLLRPLERRGSNNEEDADEEKDDDGLEDDDASSNDDSSDDDGGSDDSGDDDAE